MTASDATPEGYALQSAGDSMGALFDIGSAPDDQASDMVQGIAQAPEMMASEVFSGFIAPPVGAVRASARASVVRRATAFARGDVAAATANFQDTCITVSPTAIHFTNCSEPLTGDSGTGSVTLNGVFNRSEGHVDWDATLAMSFSGTMDGHSGSLRFSDHMVGDLDFSSTSIQGAERSDIFISLQEDSMNASASVTYSADFNLTSDGVCQGPTAGTLTLKQIWGEKPHGSGIDPADANVSDQAVQFQWNACNSVTVSWGTL